MKISLNRAVAAARKKLPIIPDKKLRENLEWATGNDLAEAYRLGAQEAQHEIISRLVKLGIQTDTAQRTG